MIEQVNTVRQETLDNGLTVMLVPRPGDGVVTVDMWVGTGSADETAEVNGISHFLEHMLFKGTAQYKVGEIDRMIEGVGGIINAGTSHDFTHYYVTVAAEEFQTALHTIAQVIQHSSIDPDELDNERQVILEEYARKQDDPFGLLFEQLYQDVFAQGPYKAAVLGTPQSLAAIDSTIMRDYYHRHYAPQNMTLMLVGDFDADAALAAAAEQFSGFDRPYKPLLSRDNHKTEYVQGLDETISKDVHETYAAMALPAPAMDNPADVYALDVLQFILGGGEASMLTQDIKEKRRLVSSIMAGYSSSRYPDLFYIAYTCSETNRAAVREAIWQNLDFCAQNLPKQKDFDRAKKLLTNAHLFSLETTSGESSSIGYYYTVTGGLQFERDYIQGVQAVTPEQVQEQARRIFQHGSDNHLAVCPREAQA